jgi:hypothetical protein
MIRSEAARAMIDPWTVSGSGAMSVRSGEDGAGASRI